MACTVGHTQSSNTDEINRAPNCHTVVAEALILVLVIGLGLSGQLESFNMLPPVMVGSRTKSERSIFACSSRQTSLVTNLLKPNACRIRVSTEYHELPLLASLARCVAAIFEDWGRVRLFTTGGGVALSCNL